MLTPVTASTLGRDFIALLRHVRYIYVLEIQAFGIKTEKVDDKEFYYLGAY